MTDAELTAAINALPDPLRRYVINLATDADPSGTIRENFLLRNENEMLRRECENLAQRSNLTKP